MRAPKPKAPKRLEAEPVERPAYSDWVRTSFGHMLVPRDLAESGKANLFFHFHAGKMAGDEWRRAGHGAIIAVATYGVGTRSYAKPFENPERFARMLDEIREVASTESKRKVTFDHIGLVAWSAGYAAIGRILQDPDFYARADAVVLLDGLHSSYIHVAGKKRTDPEPIRVFIRYAKDAADSKKVFAYTHSSIVPPGYPSTTETAAVIEGELGLERHEGEPLCFRTVERNYTAERGEAHIEGFSGTGKAEHIAHIRMLDRVIEEYVWPAWTGAEARNVRGERYSDCSDRSEPDDGTAPGG